MSQYRSLISCRPPFSGIYWGNFIGARLLSNFDREKLVSITAPIIDWAGTDALFLFASGNIADAEPEATEQIMISLTKALRQARMQTTTTE